MIDWEQRKPMLLEAEKKAMRKYFPKFALYKFSDGRLYWSGRVQPSKYGKTYEMMAVYDLNHPHNNTYGGSIKIYVDWPKTLDEMRGPRGQAIPHLLTDSNGHKYICTNDPKLVGNGHDNIQTAVQAISNGMKFLVVYEGWMDGIVGDEFNRDYY